MMMMVASPLSSGASGRKLNMPSPYDLPLNKGLDKNAQRNPALEPHLQHQQDLLAPQPRVGSTQALIKQREVLQQDVFQKQNTQDTNRRANLELPQKAPSVMEQLQQVANTTRQFLSQLDRLNQSDLTRRQAQGTELQISEGRHQVHHQNATLYMRIKEPSFVTKSKREEDIMRRTARQQRMGIKAKDAHSEKHRNVSADQVEDALF